jgi:hypothetical protein
MKKLKESDFVLSLRADEHRRRSAADRHRE